MTRALEAWFHGAGRAMPWRPVAGFRLPRDPYGALVSEFMLQQTQVSRVLAYFPRFMAEFPSARALAEAPEQRVLALWAGLGYYRRARNLHAAARAIVAHHGGRVPRDAATLETLPGVGRYTAGAIASIVFGARTAAVDGNVVRVLLRVEGRDLDPSAGATRDWTWVRATELVEASGEPGAWNEGLMELGATVCLPPPARPRCHACPLARWCLARCQGTTDRIPRPKRPARARVEVVHTVVACRRVRGTTAVLLEQRGTTGLWAGLWCTPSVSGLGARAGRGAVAGVLGGTHLARVGVVNHATTARTVRFIVWRAASVPTRGRRWVPLDRLHEVPVSNAHLKVLHLAGVVSSGAVRPPRAPAGATRAARGSRRRG